VRAVDGVEIGPQCPGRLSRVDGHGVLPTFHLFARLYGIDPPESGEAAALLQWMEVERSTALDGDRFSRRDLSAGQRKRAGADRRPSGAQADSGSRTNGPRSGSAVPRKFYREILPELKRRGLTIVAVTHDDHYFDAAGRRLHMEEGRLTELAAGGGA